MAKFSEKHPIKGFGEAFAFAFWAGLLPAFLGFGIFFLLSLFRLPYYVMAGFSPLLLFFVLRKISLDWDSVSTNTAEITQREPGLRVAILYSMMLTGFNALFPLISFFTSGPEEVSRINTLADSLLTPYWWIEIPFFGLWMGLRHGATLEGSFLDSALFLSAHKTFAKRLILWFWLPLAIAGFLLPGFLLLPLSVAAWFAGPALVFAGWLHPGDQDGGGHREQRKRETNLDPSRVAIAFGKSQN